MRILGMSQPKYIPPLNNALAIQTGSELVGELLIFIIAVSLLLLEFSRYVSFFVFVIYKRKSLLFIKGKRGTKL